MGRNLEFTMVRAVAYIRYTRCGVFCLTDVTPVWETTMIHDTTYGTGKGLAGSCLRQSAKKHLMANYINKYMLSVPVKYLVYKLQRRQTRQQQQLAGEATVAA